MLVSEVILDLIKVLCVSSKIITSRGISNSHTTRPAHTKLSSLVPYTILLRP